MRTKHRIERLVVERALGWVVVTDEFERPSAFYRTQAEATAQAQELVEALGGGRVVVRGHAGAPDETLTVLPRADVDATVSS